jgi:uncharacterized membrane protein YhaH (DUF805 family)
MTTCMTVTKLFFEFDGTMGKKELILQILLNLSINVLKDISKCLSLISNRSVCALNE